MKGISTIAAVWPVLVIALGLTACATAPAPTPSVVPPAPVAAVAEPVFHSTLREQAAVLPYSVADSVTFPEPDLSLPADATASMSVLYALWPVLPEAGSEAVDAFGMVAAGSSSGRTITALLRRAQEATAKGQHDRAIAELERALRIEPRNAFIWSTLAQAYLGKGMLANAESMALRSNSLARGNRRIETQNQRIISAARGGEPAGASLQTSYAGKEAAP